MVTSPVSSMPCSISSRIENAPRNSAKSRPMTNYNSRPPRRRLGEFEAIAKFFAPLSAKAKGAFGLIDDVATLSLAKGQELVTKVDAIVEGVHFLRTDPPGDIARKALRVSLSDL